ncbi:HlyD family secretion protein [Chitinimonas koreensis]|uniref:HlyD family secretion protein n=1 Tax=Chitinimonas koreensis TaxID=356302 RepID=UPI00041DE92E|nr:HlyD family secretion protein [Chitinimonas koreensis]QNM95623.1 HlyD family secretion protein [Chitinimonas koreensis]
MSDVSQPKKQNKARIVFALAAVGIAGWVGYHWWHGRTFVETDNAQVEGHIVPVAAKVSGYVTRVDVSDNQSVAAGAVLVQIDDRDYAARLAQVEADLKIAVAAAGGKNQTGQAEAQVGFAQASASAAQSAISQADAGAEYARNELNRIRSLASKGMATASQLDAAQTALRTAESQLKTARDTANAAGKQIGVAGAGLKSAQAKVDSVRAQRDLAAIQLGDTQVKAPVAGVSSKKSVEIGQLVQPGQTLLYLVPLQDVWVTANLKETEVGKVKAGQPVEVEVDAYPGKVFSGKVDSFSAATGAKFALLPPDNASGNFTKVVQRVPVKVKLDAYDSQATPLRPGMSVVASIRIR